VKLARLVGIGLMLMLLAVPAVLGLRLHREGWRAYIIHTGSMTGTYDSGGLVIDKPVTSPLRVGQTITFLHSGLSSDVVTHRIVGLKDGTIQTKGDANKVADTWDIRHNQVKGAVVQYLPHMGYVVYFLKHRSGDAAVMTGLLAMVLLWELFFETADAEAAECATRSPAPRAPQRDRRNAPASI
jgi:signal peptidase